MSWDYIIVGAGSSGCALAYELINSGRTVLIIEAGGSDWSPFIKVPAGVLRAGANHDWGYQSQPDLTRNGATESWPRGRVLGGSSSINGMMYVRGAAEDFDRWNIPEWSAAKVLPIYREMEHSDQQSPTRGHCGPVHVRTIKRPHAVTESFIASACASGYPFNSDYNGERQYGIGYAQLTQRRGFRWSSADAFLKPLLGRRNVKLLLHTFVEKIELENGRAVAVSTVCRGARRRETAGNVILCAGAINSPKLLMLSGVGDARELSRHNLHVVMDLPGVGRHLKEHPLVTLTYRSKVPTNNLTEGVLQGLGIAASYLVHGEGPIANIFEGAAFLRSRDAEPSPDLQVVFMTCGWLKDPDGELKRVPYPAVGVHIMESYPKSSGRIRLKSKDAKDPPLIECLLLGEQSDVDTLVRGIRVVRRIMSTPPIRSLMEREIVPGAELESELALQDFVRNHADVSFHPVGTCRMGVGADAVVGPDLRVHGIDNLWVADASIVPCTLSANMNAPCMMIGLKLGKHLTAH